MFSNSQINFPTSYRKVTIYHFLQCNASHKSLWIHNTQPPMSLERCGGFYYAKSILYQGPWFCAFSSSEIFCLTNMCSLISNSPVYKISKFLSFKKYPLVFFLSTNIYLLSCYVSYCLPKKWSPLPIPIYLSFSFCPIHSDFCLGQSIKHDLVEIAEDLSSKSQRYFSVFVFLTFFAALDVTAYLLLPNVQDSMSSSSSLFILDHLFLVTFGDSTLLPPQIGTAQSSNLVQLLAFL